MIKVLPKNRLYLISSDSSFSLEPTLIRSSSHCHQNALIKITDDIHAVKSKGQLSVLLSFCLLVVLFFLKYFLHLVSKTCPLPWVFSYLNGLFFSALFVEFSFIFPTSKNWSVQVLFHRPLLFPIYIHTLIGVLIQTITLNIYMLWPPKFIYLAQLLSKLQTCLYVQQAI